MPGGAEPRVACTRKSAELVVAGLLFALGAVVVYGSARLGAHWAAEGPQPGYFPFYVGIVICISALVTFVRALAIRPEHDKPFVHVGALKMVLAVLVPTAIYAGVIALLGMYVASALFIAFFMRWLGKYAWWKVLLVSVGISVFFYFVFEVWFEVPLPKGPVEVWLGLA